MQLSPVNSVYCVVKINWEDKMTEQNQDPTQDQTETPHSTAEGPWNEVGKQFEELGDSLSRAFRAAWNDEENRRRAREMQAGLESMIREVGKAIDETAQSPQARQVRQDAEKAMDNLRNAGEQTVQEVRPHLVDALRQVNQELQKFVERMEKRETK